MAESSETFDKDAEFDIFEGQDIDQVIDDTIEHISDLVYADKELGADVDDQIDKEEDHVRYLIRKYYPNLPEGFEDNFIEKWYVFSKDEIHYILEAGTQGTSFEEAYHTYNDVRRKEWDEEARKLKTMPNRIRRKLIRILESWVHRLEHAMYKSQKS